MKLPRMRFTVRQVMVAVAMVAIAFGAWLMGERRGAYLNQAELNARKQQEYIEHLAVLRNETVKLVALMTRPGPRHEADTEERYQARVKRWTELRASDSLTKIRLGTLSSRTATAQK